MTTIPITQSSICDPAVRGVLDRLHAEASRQIPGIARLLLTELPDMLLGRKVSVAEEARRLKDLYVPVTKKQGTFLYLVARSVAARRIVEFGTSFGISTIYLAAAVRDNGGGVVIGSEFEPTKVLKARANFAEAGLAELVDLRQGDAQETLRDPAGVVDMVYLDGLKNLYLPMIQMLAPHLRQGGVVVADNIFTFKRALSPYVEYMRDPANGFSSITLHLKDGTAYSVKL